ncbi:hypothetical protein [Nocardioides sp. 1609]|uniref:hypothetical protein n=1 Tax=Nocardioides sp. 1609 TaxID=2508327 RepID=UPI0014306DF7|nr:hypothetical protein [Nocardioides sp. 1609]
MNQPATLRPLTHADLDWAVEAARARRAALAPHAPRFWRPAADATERHRAFLAHLVDDAATLTLRTDHGYVVAVPGERRRVVDDLVVSGPAWESEGTALLGAVLDAGQPVRLAAPAAEPERKACAEALGLTVTEVWWHRDLPLVQVRGEGGKVRLDAPGASGTLVPAPPVHDPGGSVLLVTSVDTAAALAAVEAEAAERGATVSVVTQRPDDLMRELLLVEAGHRVTTYFLEGSR